ncbi:formate/nitrite transporter family protein [Gemmata sp.]|uniref:formate/nitrite transporter family protein n=1 Tax=Gemmata sp. TaxID=1914242 RepID=UPI003F7217AF
MANATQQRPDAQQAEERTAPSGRVVYKAILKEGEEELERASAALFWSGLSMGFSLIAEGLLTARLPDEPWRPLVSKFGYSTGFLIVVLGRQQLFTENTLTPVLPLLKRRERATAANLLRLWAVVLAANLLGALAVALAVTHGDAFGPADRAAFAEIGRRALAPGFGEVVARGVFAGWLIALMVWLLPFAESGRVWVIIVLSYVVGVGEFSHVIAGSAEVFAAAAAGGASWAAALGGFVAPALVGNVIGGVALVAVLNHAQVVSGESGNDL